VLETDGEETFGALLRGHRLAAGLTQAMLAEKAGISTRGIQDLERVSSQPHSRPLEWFASNHFVVLAQLVRAKPFRSRSAPLRRDGCAPSKMLRVVRCIVRPRAIRWLPRESMLPAADQSSAPSRATRDHQTRDGSRRLERRTAWPPPLQ
jgi:transcriptional regulator with XRE-family HTH domain